MKKWLAIVASTALLGSGFASEHDQEIAFARGRDRDDKPKEKTKFFVGYKLFLTQPGEDNSRQNYATSTDANNLTSNLNNNFDWDYGHYGVIGVQLPKTMFKVFVEGWFFHNKKNKTNEANGNTFSTGTAFNLGSLTVNPTQVKGCGKNDFYMIDLFVSYAAYRKGNFFFVPYIGPRYVQGKNNITGIFSDGTNSDTFTNNLKSEGFGVVMAFMLKYFFTSRFYAFGDYRYSVVFARKTSFQSYSTTSQQGTPASTLNIQFDTDEMFELAFGLGVLAVNKENWNLAIDACYKLIRWGDADQHYQALGLGVMLGF